MKDKQSRSKGIWSVILKRNHLFIIPNCSFRHNTNDNRLDLWESQAYTGKYYSKLHLGIHRQWNSTKTKCICKQEKEQHQFAWTFWPREPSENLIRQGENAKHGKTCSLFPFFRFHSLIPTSKKILFLSLQQIWRLSFLHTGTNYAFNSLTAQSYPDLWLKSQE